MESSEMETDLNVLLLEDDESDRNRIVPELKKRGFRVAIVTENPDDILVAIQNDTSGEIEVALLDWEIGENKEAGPLTCEKIKELRAQVRVFALTKFSGSWVADNVGDKGFDGYFCKLDLFGDTRDEQYDQMVEKIVDRVNAIRRRLPKALLECRKFDQATKDAFYRQIEGTGAAARFEKLISVLATDELKEYISGDMTSETLGRKYGVAVSNDDVRINNILISRRVLLGMYSWCGNNTVRVMRKLGYPIDVEYSGTIEEAISQVKQILSNKGGGLISHAGEAYDKDSPGFPREFGTFFDKVTVLLGSTSDTVELDLTIIQPAEKKGQSGGKSPIREKRFEFRYANGNIYLQDSLKYNDAFERLLERCCLAENNLRAPTADVFFEKELLWFDNVRREIWFQDKREDFAFIPLQANSKHVKDFLGKNE